MQADRSDTGNSIAEIHHPPRYQERLQSSDSFARCTININLLLDRISRSLAKCTKVPFSCCFFSRDGFSKRLGDPLVENAGLEVNRSEVCVKQGHSSWSIPNTCCRIPGREIYCITIVSCS